MSNQGIFVLQHPPDRVFLVRVKIIVAKSGSVHSRKREMRPIIGSQPDIVERIVIEPCQTFGTLLIFPYPLSKAVFEFLLRFPCGDGFCLVNNAGIIFEGIINGRDAHI